MISHKAYPVLFLCVIFSPILLAGFFIGFVFKLLLYSMCIGMAGATEFKDKIRNGLNKFAEKIKDLTSEDNSVG